MAVKASAAYYKLIKEFRLVALKDDQHRRAAVIMLYKTLDDLDKTTHANPIGVIDADTLGYLAVLAHLLKKYDDTH